MSVLRPAVIARTYEQIRAAHAKRPVRLRPLPRRVDEIRGVGSWGLIQPCDGYVLVDRYPSQAEAERVLSLGRYCGHACWLSQHQVIGPLREWGAGR